MVPWSKVAEKRGLVRGICGKWVSVISVGPGIIDMEMIQFPGGTVTGELLRLLAAAGLFQQLAKDFLVLRRHLLLLAISAQAFHAAFDEQPRLVERISQRLASIAANHEIARLRHEGAHMARIAFDNDVH